MRSYGFMKNSFNDLKIKINSKKLIIGVIGLGYVGLPLGLSLASKGFKVFGIDNDKKKISILKKKQSYINSISLKSLKKVNNKFFFPTTEMEKVTECDAIIICVPTPIDDFKNPLVKYIVQVIKKIKKYIRKNQIIILECTTYPGTTEEFFLPIIKKKKLILGKNFFLGYSPEREDPGNKIYSISKGNLPKVVSGYTKECEKLVSMIYLKITNKIYKTENIKSAEFSKLLENIYRSVNISLINELTLISKKLNLNINDIINAASTKPFGFQSFYPGPGVGGHCIPVDPYFLYWKAKKLGINLEFIKLAGRVNDKRPIILSKEILNYLRNSKFKKSKGTIVFYGVTYKKDSDDIRESPSRVILKNINESFKKIKVCDPVLSNLSKRALREYDIIKDKKNYYKFNNKKDIAIILANHSKFNYQMIRKKFKIVFDCRNSFHQPYKNVIQI